MFDRASLRECESNEDMLRLVPDIKGGWGRGGNGVAAPTLAQAGFQPARYSLSVHQPHLPNRLPAAGFANAFHTQQLACPL